MLQKSYYIPRTGKREAGAWNARRGRDLQPPPEMNIDHACTETRMCSVAYSSTTHRSYTDEHTTQPHHKTLTPEGSRTGLGVVVHSTVYVYASMEYSVVWYSGLQRWLRSALRPAKMARRSEGMCTVGGDSGDRSKGIFSADGGHFRSDGTPRGTTPPVDVKYGDGRFNYYTTNLYEAAGL